jgi:hypothetical protein
VLTNGSSQITLTGVAGQTYGVQASTDFVNWVTLANLPMRAASAKFVDSFATNFSRRFYRAAGM